MTAQDEDLARRVYAYFIFRLRQPADAERLARLTFERVWAEDRLRTSEPDQEPDLPVFASARAVIADNPRPRVSTRVAPARKRDQREALSNELEMAIGRLHRRERDALALRFGAELTVGEIAGVIDRTPADVKQRLARGVRALRELGIVPKPRAARKPARSSAAEWPRSRRTKGGEAKKPETDDQGESHS